MALLTLTNTPSLKPVTSLIRLLALLLSVTAPPPVSVVVVRLIWRSDWPPEPSRAMVPLLVMVPVRTVLEPLTW